MRDSKTKFKIKTSNSIIRVPGLPKSATVEDKLDISPRGEDSTFKIDDYRFATSEQNIIKKSFSQNLESEIFASKFSPDDSKAAMTLLDGKVFVLNSKVPSLSYSYTVNQNGSNTALVWRDANRFLVGDTESHVYEFEHLKEENTLKQIHKHVDPDDDHVFSIDLNQAQELMIYAGKNMTINLINDNTKQLVRKYEPGDSFQLGHTNRIFCTKFVENQPNMFISGGWDNTMFLWDVRISKAVASAFGPSVSGESLDIKDNLIVAGSYRDKHPLELYDLRNFKKICDVETGTIGRDAMTYISSCQFSKLKGLGDYLIAGSCISGKVDIFKKDIVYKVDVAIKDIGSGVYSCGFSNVESKFFFGTASGSFNVYHYFNM